jgi:hypothetical protein
MDAKEVRIGNLVYGAEKIVYKITSDLIHILESSPNWVNPIPLTKNELLKLGFIVSFGTTLVLRINNKGVLLVYDLNNKTCNGLDTIKYVHQLQNLYFALTNKELTWRTK